MPYNITNHLANATMLLSLPGMAVLLVWYIVDSVKARNALVRRCGAIKELAK